MRRPWMWAMVALLSVGTATTGLAQTATAAGAGGRVALWETTATLQYKIWRGLVGRLDEDSGSKVF